MSRDLGRDVPDLPCPQGVLLEGALKRDFLEVALSSNFLGLRLSEELQSHFDPGDPPPPYPAHPDPILTPF